MRRKKSEQVNELLDEIDGLLADFEKERSASGHIVRDIEKMQEYPSHFDSPKHSSIPQLPQLGFSGITKIAMSVVNNIRLPTFKGISFSFPSIKQSTKKIQTALSTSVAKVKDSKISWKRNDASAFGQLEYPSISKSKRSAFSFINLPHINMEFVLSELRGMVRYKTENSKRTPTLARLAVPLSVLVLVVSAVFLVMNMNSTISEPTTFAIAKVPKSSIQQVVVTTYANDTKIAESPISIMNLCEGAECNSPPNVKCYATIGVCSQGGVCNYQQMPVGTVCDDNRGCTTLDSCDPFGECRGTSYCPDACEGSKWLTAGTCQQSGECSYINIECEHGCDKGKCIVPEPLSLPETESSNEILSGYFAEYYDNMDLVGIPVLTRTDSSINFQWQNTHPDTSLPSDKFSVRWSKNISFDSSNYRFTVRADDGVRVFLNGEVIPELDHWKNQIATTYTTERQMRAGVHFIVVEYFENTFDATIFFDVVKVAVITPPTILPPNTEPPPPNTPPPTTTPPPPITPPTATPPPTTPPPSSGGAALSINSDKISIGGQITYPGSLVEGSLVTIRTANGVFDTRTHRSFFDDYGSSSQGKVWGSNNAVYGAWNAGANTDRLIAALPSYRQAGVRAISVNLQGGCSCSRDGEDGMKLSGVSQTPDNNPYLKNAQGNLYIDPPYLQRLGRLIEAARSQNMIVVVGVLYFGQEHRISNSNDRLMATELLANWVIDNGYRNVVIEAKNENQGGEALQMIQRVKQVAQSRGTTLYATTSLGYKEMPSDQYLSQVDLVLVHTNGYPANNAGDGYSVTQVIQNIRSRLAYQSHRTPILITEDGPVLSIANLNAASQQGVGWGYYNDREKQSVPTNYQLFSSSDQQFASAISVITS